MTKLGDIYSGGGKYTGGTKIGEVHSTSSDTGDIAGAVLATAVVGGMLAWWGGSRLLRYRGLPITWWSKVAAVAILLLGIPGINLSISLAHSAGISNCYPVDPVHNATGTRELVTLNIVKYFSNPSTRASAIVLTSTLNDDGDVVVATGAETDAEGQHWIQVWGPTDRWHRTWKAASQTYWVLGDNVVERRTNWCWPPWAHA